MWDVSEVEATFLWDMYVLQAVRPWIGSRFQTTFISKSSNPAACNEPLPMQVLFGLAIVLPARALIRDPN